MKVDALTASQLVKILETSSGKLLVVDCRPFQMYNRDRIHGSVNAFCPPILKRRLGAKGFIRLEAVVGPETRKKLRCGDFSQLVLYDDNNLDKDLSDINLLLQGLRQYSYSIQSVYVLKGGFASFRQKFHHHCERHKDNTEKQTPMQLSISHTSEQSPPTELLPHLYLGDESHPGNTEQLHRLGITSVLNVSTSTAEPDVTQFTYKRIPIRDTVSENISTCFTEALQFIDSMRRQGGKILVHCKAGVSRSATICIAYLMAYKSLTLDQAFSHVQSRRSIISPNMSFMQQLFEFEGVLHIGQRRGSLVTSSPVMSPMTCAQTSEMSPSINSTQNAFNVCAISNL